jgi:ubiquinone biosynthesis protein COQ9
VTEQTLAPALALRERLVDALLEIAGEQGWNSAAIAVAGAKAGLTPGEIELAAPGGASQLIDAFADRLDRAMTGELAGADLKAMKVRERVAFAVRTRIELTAPYREAARRSLAHIGLKRDGLLAGKLAWRTADAIWRALDDLSTDGNYYSKRALLAGIFAGAFAIWLQDRDAGSTRAWDFLAARIENVMQFEKFKATRLRPLGYAAVAAVGELAKWRYRRAEEPPIKPAS